ncbi:MAG: phosphoglucomutase [Myxococcota bacterium]|jgi:phosphoglucomutase
MTAWLHAAAHGIRALDLPPHLAEAAVANLGRWVADHPADGPTLEHLAAMGRFAALADAFYQTLPFGTGGRRGAIGVGPNRINPHTVGASVQGHVAWLRQRFPGEDLRIVIAYDVRAFHDVAGVYAGAPCALLGLSSRGLSEHAARVYAANGVTCWLLPRDAEGWTSTPELSFAIRTLQAHGGLNLSASHNPPDDNGVKVFDQTGAQLVPPHDQSLLDTVAQVGTVAIAEWDAAVADGSIRPLPASIHRDYVATIAALARPGARDVHVVYTPLHGTGCVHEILAAAGFRVTLHAPQAAADALFSTVPGQVANPERPVALAHAIAAAADADLVLGTDPDADRIGCAVRHADGWVHLSGNAIAVLVVDEMLQREWTRTPLVVLTEVTSRLVSRVARAAGAAVVDDLLVGFKYIGELLAHLDDGGTAAGHAASDLVFIAGVEESNGVLVTADIRDKDSGGGALMLALAAARARAAGHTLVDRLAALEARHGVIRNAQVRQSYAGAAGLAKRAALLDALRQAPPATFAGRDVVSFTDHRSPTGRFGPIRSESDAASRNVLVLELGTGPHDDGARVVLRPSGTEPKVKVYLQVLGKPGLDAAGRAAVEVTLAELGDAARAELAG